MHIMYAGSVGSGKTLGALKFVLDCPGDNVYANMHINLEEPKKLLRWSQFDAIKAATCGVVLIDEASMFLDAREFAKLDPTIKDLIKEHRKHHLRIVTTTQDVSFIDKMFRILCDEVRLMRKLSLPIIGWIFPDCVRPNIVCSTCKEIRIDDGIGDRVFWWQRWFGFGTIYVYKVYPPSILGEQENASGEELERKEVKALRSGWFAWSTKKFMHLYDTSAKVSTDAADFRLHRSHGKS